jgi:hypothetical protein
MVGVTNVVRDLETAAQLYGRLFGQEGTPSATGGEGTSSSLRYTLGAQWVEIVQPADSSSELGQYLERRGPGPYEVVFGKSESVQRGILQPLSLSHGARLRIAE